MNLTPEQRKQASDIDRIHQLIVEEPKKHASRLPENIFRDYFLPVFAGLAPMGTHYEEWISIAGAPSAEVSIVNETGVLFNVPPLMNTDHIKRERPEGAMPFAAIVSMAQAFRTKSGAQGENVMTKQGIERYKASHDTKHDYSVDEKRWIDIFQRYGVLPATPTDNTAKEAIKPSTGIDDDEFVES